jgi:osmotically inducible lipoprotein OsmB
MIRKSLGIAVISLFLAACGTAEEDRALTGAGIGAAGGALVGGPVGALAGAGVGAGTGTVTEEEDIDLGEPIWDDPTFWD